MSLKLLGFAVLEEVENHQAFAKSLHRELIAAKAHLGQNFATVSFVKNEADLVFLRACIELRIPTIVLLPASGAFPERPEAGNLLGHLLSVSLARYALPEAQSQLAILEWADALMCVGKSGDEILTSDALALGVPLCRIDLSTPASIWSHLPQASAAPKHGFPTRRELLEFLDQRFG